MREKVPLKTLLDPFFQLLPRRLDGIIEALAFVGALKRVAFGRERRPADDYYLSYWPI